MQQPSSGTMLRRGGGAGVGGLRRSDRVVAVHRRLPHSRSLAVSRAQPLAQVIADVLNEQAKQQSGTELLSNIDSMGGSVTTTVTRIWEGEAASLKVVGSWPEGEVAKRMALLAVYQETVWRRNQLLAATFKRVLRHRPGLFPQQSTKQVLDTLAANTMNGALEALGIPELLQLAVVVVPLEQLEGVVREAVGRAGQELRARALARPSRRPPPNLQPELRRVSAAWVYRAHLARLRLHHAPAMEATARALEHLRRQAARRAAPALESFWDEDSSDTDTPLPPLSPPTPTPWPPTPGSDAGLASSGTPPPSPPTPPAPPSSEPVEQSFLRGQLAVYSQPGLTGPYCGRPGWIAFGRGPPPLTHLPPPPPPPAPSPSSSQAEDSGGGLGEGGRRSSWSAGQLPRGALERGPGGVGAAGFGAEVVVEMAQAAAAGRQAAELVRQGGYRVLQGVALACERVLRERLADTVCCWAEPRAHLLGLNPLAAACSHGTSIQASMRDHVVQRMRVEVKGGGLPYLRQQAAALGPGCLQLAPSPTALRLAAQPQWSYSQQAPAVWEQCVQLPPSPDTTALTLKWRAQPSPLAPPSPSLSPPSATTTPLLPPNAGSGPHNSAPGGVEAEGQLGAGVGGGLVSGVRVAAPPPEEVVVQLSLAEAQAFMSALLQLLPPATLLAGQGQQQRQGQVQGGRPLGHSSRGGGSRGSGAGPWLGGSHLQVRLSSPSLPVAPPLLAADPPPSSLEIRWRCLAPAPAPLTAHQQQGQGQGQGQQGQQDQQGQGHGHGQGQGQQGQGQQGQGQQGQGQGQQQRDVSLAFAQSEAELQGQQHPLQQGTTSRADSWHTHSLAHSRGQGQGQGQQQGQGPAGAAQWQGPRRLTPDQLRSLLNIYDHVSSHLPALLPTPPPLRPPGPPSPATTATASTSSSPWMAWVARAAAGAALVAAGVAVAVAGGGGPGALGAGLRGGSGGSWGGMLAAAPGVVAGGVGWGVGRVAAAITSPVGGRGEGEREGAALPAAAPPIVEVGSPELPAPCAPHPDSQSGGAVSLATSAGPGARQLLQPLAPSLAPDLPALCSRVCGQVDGRLWLPVAAAQPPGQQGLGQQQLFGGWGGASGAKGAAHRLSYQVLVHSTTCQVLGCMPLDAASAAWYPQLPLAAALRSTAFQQQQARRLAACEPGALNAVVPPSPMSATYEPARYYPLATAEGVSSSNESAGQTRPAAAVVVLHLALEQQAELACPAGASSKGKAPVLVAPMKAHVRPWRDGDSVAAWASVPGSSISYDDSVAASNAEAHGPSRESSDAPYPLPNPIVAPEEGVLTSPVGSVLAQLMQAVQEHASNVDVKP